MWPFFLNPEGPEVPDGILSRTRLIEIPDGKDVVQRAQQLKKASAQLRNSSAGAFRW